MKQLTQKYLVAVLVLIVVAAAVVVVVMKPSKQETFASVPVVPTGSNVSLMP